MQYGYVYIQKNTVLVKHKQTEQKYFVLSNEKKKERKKIKKGNRTASKKIRLYAGHAFTTL